MADKLNTKTKEILRFFLKKAGVMIPILVKK